MQSSTAQRTPLPVAGDFYITEAGLETELVFIDEIDLPHFAACTLLTTADGRDRLYRYYQTFVRLAEEKACGIFLETTTWRLNTDWAERLGYKLADRIRINHAAVSLLKNLKQQSSIAQDKFVISGNVGPRYDGYQVDTVMSADEAAAYHGEQIAHLDAAGADVISALTMTTSQEATGVALACAAQGIPAVISFTVETDGRLPSGETLKEAITKVDNAVPDSVSWFGINCAHPTHFIEQLRSGASWIQRLGAIRANASKKSHAELDESTELDAGNPEQLAIEYAEIRELAPNLRVLGGCCGTDLNHINHICQHAH